MIDLRVDGQLSLDRRDLDIDVFEQLVEDATGALHVQTQVSVTTADILDLIEDLDEGASVTVTHVRSGLALLSPSISDRF